MPSTKKNSAIKKATRTKVQKSNVRVRDMRPQRNPIGGVPINGMDEVVRQRPNSA